MKVALAQFAPDIIFPGWLTGSPTKLLKTKHRRSARNCCSDLRMERPEPYSATNIKTEKWGSAEVLKTRDRQESTRVQRHPRGVGHPALA